MAQFYASMQGNRGERTRMGTKSSGIVSHTRGWNVGVQVELEWDEKKQRDVASVFITGGSSKPMKLKKLLTLTEEDVAICSN